MSVQRLSPLMLSSPLAIGVAMTATLMAVLAMKPARAEPATPGDIVVERQIGPRIAYRGLPRDQNVIALAVPAFPTQPFGQVMDTFQGATDAELGAHGSVGLVGSAVMSGVAPVTSLLTGTLVGGGSGGLTAGGGVGGGFAGAIVGATGGIASTVTGAIGAAMPALSGIGAVGVVK